MTDDGDKQERIKAGYDILSIEANDEDVALALKDMRLKEYYKGFVDGKHEYDEAMQLLKQIGNDKCVKCSNHQDAGRFAICYPCSIKMKDSLKVLLE
jgi:hypothetical protein